MLKGSENDENFSGLPGRMEVQDARNRKTVNHGQSPQKRKEEDMKKFLAMLLALVMVMGMSVTVFAEPDPDTTKKMPTSGDELAASVNDIKQAGVTVTAYKVVEANYDAERGFTGYSWVKETGYTKDLFINVEKDGKTTKTLNIDEASIIKLANMAKVGTLGNGVPMTAAAGSTTYSAILKAGSYVVLVTGSNDIIYNPMLVGVYYTLQGTGDNNTLETEEISALDSWDLFATDGFVKSSEPGVTKEIVNPGSNNDHGDDVAIGDTVSFKISTTMPSYSDEYTAPKFNVSDTISKGLTYKDDTLVVKAGGTELTKGTDYTLDPAFASTARTFKVNFTQTYIENNKNAEITIEYSAILNSEAGINYDANTNKATLEYSNNPDPEVDLKTKDDTTYHYTFGIDAKLNGSNSNTTQELYKLDENGTAIVNGETVTVTNPLPGAKFTLQKKNEDGSLDTDPKHKYEAVSADDGSLNFEGLDAGTYVLVETEAPKGYSLDPTEHTVVISATYYDGTEDKKVDKGRLKSYTIKIDGEVTSTYTATYDSTTNTITTIDKTELGVTGIKNTKLASLPSTGGIGTTIFTFGGCAIMIIAAGLYFATRRKSAK